MRFELLGVPIVTPCGDLPVTQLKCSHARYADPVVADQKMIYALGHHDITICYDVTNFPRQRSHSLRATSQGIPDGVTSFNGLPRRIPPSSILVKIAREFFRIGSHAGVNEPTDEGYAVSVFQRNDLPSEGYTTFRADRRRLGDCCGHRAGVAVQLQRALTPHIGSLRYSRRTAERKNPGRGATPRGWEV